MDFGFLLRGDASRGGGFDGLHLCAEHRTRLCLRGAGRCGDRLRRDAGGYERRPVRNDGAGDVGHVAFDAQRSQFLVGDRAFGIAAVERQRCHAEAGQEAPVQRAIEIGHRGAAQVELASRTQRADVVEAHDDLFAAVFAEAVGGPIKPAVLDAAELAADLKLRGCGVGIRIVLLARGGRLRVVIERRNADDRLVLARHENGMRRRSN